MSILEGAYWISSQKYRKYLKADPDGTVHGVDPGPRGIEILDSTSLRARIWLIEKAIDWKSFRLRNYETGFALDIKDRKVNNESPVIVTRGSTESQLWRMELENSTNGLVYRIENIAASAVLDQIKTNEGHLTNILAPRMPYSNQVWLVEPALLPDLYRLTNQATEYVLTSPDYPNASDGISGELVLSPGESVLPTRSQLWTFEYTSLDESLIRSALYHQFALDLASDTRSVIVRKQHSEAGQRWVMKDKDTEKHLINLTNAKTYTLLVSREHCLFGSQKIHTASTALNGNIDWEIHTGSQPPLFWVTIQHSSGAFLAQANDRTIVPSRGVLHFNDHAVQWRFVMIGSDLRYIIVNRATGFVLGYDYAAAALAPTRSGTIYLGGKDEDRNNINNHWVLDVSGDSRVAIVHVGSKCALAVTTSSYGGSNYYCYCQPHSPGSNNVSSSWTLTPVYDNLPSFALVNPYTGRCLAYKPDPEIGTISSVDEVNDFRSQWLFYDPSPSSNYLDSTYVLLSKFSGNALERFKTTRIEGHDYYKYDHGQQWKIVPLYGGLIALSDSSNQHFLDDHVQDNKSKEPLPYNDHTPCWYLVSHRELGFDFFTLDLDISKRLLPHIPSHSTMAVLYLTQNYLSTRTNFRKGDTKCSYITCTSRKTRAMNETLRAILAHLIGQWVEDSISQTRQPGTVMSITRDNVEQLWSVCLSQRSLRRRSDEPGWARIDLQGVYDVGGSWKANILGQWLDKPMFQVIVPADIHVGRAVIQRAMLQSLNQELTVDVRETPSEPAILLGAKTRPGLTELVNPCRPGLGGGEEGANSLFLTLSSVPISSLRHDEL